MKYVVTCATTDSSFSNPFWHFFIFLSTVEEGKKMQVTENWGFYGVPSTTREGTIAQLKIKLGLDIDLTGNHGILQHEELRYLDLGYGLHGASFELSEDQYKTLQQRCRKQVQDQESAIEDFAKGITGKSPKNTRIYPQEEHSRHIFALEKARAKETGEAPRLKPFELHLGWSLWGPHFRNSLTCKSMSIELLTGILSPEQINRITENGKHPSIPKYSGKMERIFLHSSGPLRCHTKSSGKKVFYRDFNDEVTLQWTLPPQEIEALDKTTKSLLSVSEEYSNDAKAVISKLQRLEWLFINAELAPKHEEYRAALIKRIRHHYNAFSTIEPSLGGKTIGGFFGYTMALLNMPRNSDEHVLLQKIKNAKGLINALYMYMVDGFAIKDDLPAEWLMSDQQYHTERFNAVESLAYHLHEDAQKQLCSIIGRTHVTPLDPSIWDAAEEEPHLPLDTIDSPALAH